MSFKVDGKNYVYNAVDNKMYECGANKIYFALGKMAVDDSDELHNLETKESYDVETKMCNDYYMYNQYIPVHKKEQNFDGDVTYFGILDKNGEWVLPLSSEYAICKYKSFHGAHNATSSLAYIDSDRVYDYKNDKVIDSEELRELNPNELKHFKAISDDKYYVKMIMQIITLSITQAQVKKLLLMSREIIGAILTSSKHSFFQTLMNTWQSPTKILKCFMKLQDMTHTIYMMQQKNMFYFMQTVPTAVDIQ